MPAATRPPARPTKLSVLFCFSCSSSDCASAPLRTLLVRSLCALDALLYASAPPPSAATATPAATQATTRCAPPPRSLVGVGRGVSAAVTASEGAFAGVGGVFATAGLADGGGVAAAIVCADFAGAGAGPAAGFLPTSAAVGNAGTSRPGRGRGAGTGACVPEAAPGFGSSGSASATSVFFA